MQHGVAAAAVRVRVVEGAEEAELVGPEGGVGLELEVQGATVTGVRGDEGADAEVEPLVARPARSTETILQPVTARASRTRGASARGRRTSWTACLRVGGQGAP